MLCSVNHLNKKIDLVQKKISEAYLVRRGGQFSWKDEEIRQNARSRLGRFYLSTDFNRNNISSTTLFL